jgi:small GTP-binding protein
MTTLLTTAQAALLAEERAALQRLLELLQGWDGRPDSAYRLREALEGLNGLFLIVVTGEFNAGKSALINALLGGRFLEEGVTPTTRQVQVLSHGEATAPVKADGYWLRTLPAPLLAEMHIVDTPGTNAILRQHEALTREFVPRADLILFVTSADRPFTESERQFLEMIRNWGKKVLFVLNKRDLFERPEDQAQVEEFIRRGVEAVLGEPPILFSVSAREALRALEAASEPGLAASGWPPLAAWLRDSLTDQERLRLKLENPLGVAERILEESRHLVDVRVGVLDADRLALDEVARSIELYRADMLDQLNRRLDSVDKQVLLLRERGEVFIEEHYRLTRLRSLLNGAELRAEFERQVIGDTPDRIQDEVNALIDWIVDREHAQWQLVRRLLLERSTSEILRDAAEAGGQGFAARRQALLGSVGRQADHVVAAFSPGAESARLVMDIQDAVARTGLVEASALGLGLLLKAALAAGMAEVTGMLAAGVLAVVGLTIIPYRRRQAAEALRRRTAELREELHQTLAASFERELGASIDRMTGATEPYRRFVRAELEELYRLGQALSATGSTLESLRARIAADRTAAPGPPANLVTKT